MARIRRLVRFTRPLLGFFAVPFVAVSLLGRLGYRSLLYPAPQVDDAALPPGARVLALRAADGVPVHAVEFANPSAPRTVVYFHGNGEVVGDNIGMAQSLVAQGFAVTLVEYRGYGRSRGPSPNETGLYADASAVLDDLAARGVGADRVVLWGASLGTGVAVEMARRGRGAALVLVAPYTSIPDMAAGIVPFLPVRWIIGDRFDNAGKAPLLRLPAVVVHGTHDEVIPFAMGERVAAALPGSRFERVEGGHHMDCFLVDPALVGRVAAVVGR
jgi:pimeloyl-ACP methyl ester carboxylesterase